MDKAIISAAVALLIFTLSQVFIHLRDRQNFLRGKLEDLFEAFNGVSEKILETCYGAQELEENGEKEDLIIKTKEINKSLYKPRTLILLYFPYLVEPWEEMFVSQIFKYIDYINGVCEGEKKIEAEECMRQAREFSLKIRSLQNFLSDNVNFSTQSVGFHLKRIFTRRVKIKIRT